MQTLIWILLDNERSDLGWQLTQATKSDVSCLQMSFTHRNEKLRMSEWRLELAVMQR